MNLALSGGSRRSVETRSRPRHLHPGQVSAPCKSPFVYGLDKIRLDLRSHRPGDFPGGREDILDIIFADEN